MRKLTVTELCKYVDFFFYLGGCVFRLFTALLSFIQ